MGVQRDLGRSKLPGSGKSPAGRGGGEGNHYPNRVEITIRGRVGKSFPGGTHLFPGAARPRGQSTVCGRERPKRTAEGPVAQRLTVPMTRDAPSLPTVPMENAKFNLLRRAMSAYVQRRRALSSNLSNIDTPGYERLSVTFEEELQEARRSTADLRRPEAVEGRLEVGDEPPVLEDELMSLADTQMRTQLATRALREHFGLMRTGITGRAG